MSMYNAKEAMESVVNGLSYDNSSEIESSDKKDDYASYVPKKPCPGMLLYTEETTAAVKTLNNEQLGALVRALFCGFLNNGSLDDESEDAVSSDAIINAFFMILQPKVLRAKESYKETAYKNHVNRSKGSKSDD